MSSWIFNVESPEKACRQWFVLKQRELKRTMLLKKGVSPQKRKQVYQRKGPIHQCIYEHLSGIRNISCQKRDCSWKATTGGLPTQIKFAENRGGKVTGCHHYSAEIQLREYGSPSGRKLVRPTEEEFWLWWLVRDQDIHLNMKTLSWERWNLISCFSFPSICLSFPSIFFHLFSWEWCSLSLLPNLKAVKYLVFKFYP